MPPHRGDIHPEHGPLLEVVVRLDPAVAQSYVGSGRPVPEPVRGWGLIDTGAGQSGIDESVAIGLGLSPVGVAQLHTPTGQPLKVGVFWGEMVFAIDLPPMRQQFLGMHLNYEVAPGAPGRLIAILGRDFLRGRSFRYDGVQSRYLLEVPAAGDDDEPRVVVSFPTQV